ncbi:MAG: DUF805 domain-containing protein [Acidocella sp.]|nr:DUF805 domain-containing protein [Acidocella sp.]
MIDRLFDASGRLGRLAYFSWSVAVTLFLTIVDFLGNVLHVTGKAQGNEILIILSLVLYLVGTVLALWAGAALAARRLHDMNLPGYNIIWILSVYLAWPLLVIMSLHDVAIVDKLIVLIVSLGLIFIPGTRGSNKYD